MENCIFCQIIAGKIPSSKVYEDGKMIVFQDIDPVAKIHLLCVPKEHFATIAELNEERTALVGYLLNQIAAHKDEWGLSQGYRLVVNQGENAGQTVPHLHIHILGGETLPWG